jgi:Fic/DOC family
LARPPRERILRPAGYVGLIDTHDLRCLPPYHRSYVASWEVQRSTTESDGGREDIYPARYAPGADVISQLEFALKHDGLELGVLRALFRSVETDPFERALGGSLDARPTGANLRRIWYLYESLTARRLDRPDASGPYVPLVAPEHYFVGEPVRSRRHRVDDNLLGSLGFSPMVRRTPTLEAFAARRLDERAREVVARYDEDALRRAVAWLYTKETRSSFAIEREDPSPKRVERFVQLLRLAPRLHNLDERALIELQQAIVDPRFADSGWRRHQVYVGETIGFTERVHYVAPVASALPGLMEAYLATVRRLDATTMDPVVAAAVVAFGFVYLHPFSDGNGRVHRFLIHRELARRGYVPRDLIFPVSAVMLEQRHEYDAALETFSRPLMAQLDYELDERGEVTVRSDAADWVRHFDATPLAEALYRWVERTIDVDLPGELDFLVRFREARAAAREVVDLPDRLLDLFVNLVLRSGRLSKAKRATTFSALTDDEVRAMEVAIARAVRQIGEERGAAD